MNKLIVGNWKMNGNLSLVNEFLDSFSNENLIIAFPNIFLSYVNFKNPNFKIAAQDCSIYKDFGAHTGEISAKMLFESGAEFVIIGHSERRSTSDFDSSQNIFKKLSNAIDSGLVPILCVDEKFEKLIDEKTNELLKNNSKKIIIAYEPISAIGTGVIPTIDEIKTTISEIKENYFNIKTLYGGSVNQENSSELIEIEELDGVLIGGASLNTSALKSILRLSKKL